MKQYNCALVHTSKFRRDHLKKILEENSVSIVADTNNATDALEIIKSFQFNLLIIDFYLPKYTAIDIIKKVKTDYTNNKFSTILTSLSSESWIMQEAISIGIKDILIEPFSDKELLMAIERLK